MKNFASWSVGFALVMGLSASAAFFDSVPSTQANPDDVYVSFHLDYTPFKGEVTAETWIRVHSLTGATVRLAAPWEARFEGRPMAEVRKRFSGWTKYVAYADTDTPADSYRFEYTDGKRRVLGENVLLPKAEPVVPQGHARRSEDLIVTWDGPPAVAGESVQGFLKTEDFNEAMSEPAAAGATRLVFKAAKLAPLKAGAAKIHLIRTRVTDLKIPTRRGGRSVVSYLSKDVQVTLD